MAEKVVSVRLKALIDDYQRTMGRAAKATEDVAKKAGNWVSMGQSMSAFGDRMTRNVTLPILAVGAAAVKMASDFDAAFVQMQTLAGVSASEIDALKESVLGLASETGRGPQELAEALYFIRSAGLSGQVALDALEASAKGAAAGLGSTIQVADAVTNAINGYGAANITAAEATDVLVATAREGKAEASELAPQFGRLVPIAAELGISFDQLGGGMAFLTRSSGDTSLAATQLAGVLAKLLEPGAEGAEALEQAGMSAEGLRQSVREKGLHQALLDLRDNLEANGLQLNDFSVDQQFLQGALQLTGASAEEAAEIFAALEDSAGSSEDAFAKWAESMGAENARAFADLQVAMIRFGEVLAPIASDVLGFVGDVAKAFSGLPEGAQKAILAIAGILAALGPIMSVGGRVVTVYSAMSRALANWVIPANSVSGAFMGVNAAATTSSVGVGRLALAFHALNRAVLVVGVLVALREVMSRLRDDTDGINVTRLEGDLLDLADTGRIAGEELDKVFEGISDVSNDPGALRDLLERLETVDEALANIAASNPEAAAEAFESIKERLEDIGVQGDAEEVLNDYAEAAQAAENASRSGAGGVEEVEAAMSEVTEATESATSAMQDYLDTLRAQFDPMFAMQDALGGVRDAQSEIAAAELELAAAREEHGAGSLEALEAEQALVDARNAGARSAYDLHIAATELNDAIVNEGLSTQEAAAQMVEWIVAAGFTQEEALRMADALLVATARSDELGATDPTVQVETEGYPETMVRLGSLRLQANSIPGRRTVHADVAGYHETEVRLRAIRSAADSIPRNVNIHVTATGDAAARIAAGKLGGQWRGGPIGPGWAGWVGEQGPELLALGPNVSGHVFTEQQAASLSMPMTSAASAGGAGGGQVVHVSVSMAGAVIASSYDAQRWVSDAWNGAVRGSLVNIRPEAVRR